MVQNPLHGVERKEHGVEWIEIRDDVESITWSWKLRDRAMVPSGVDLEESITWSWKLGLLAGTCSPASCRIHYMELKGLCPVDSFVFFNFFDYESITWSWKADIRDGLRAPDHGIHYMELKASKRPIVSPPQNCIESITWSWKGVLALRVSGLDATESITWSWKGYGEQHLEVAERVAESITWSWKSYSWIRYTSLSLY